MVHGSRDAQPEVIFNQDVTKLRYPTSIINHERAYSIGLGLVLQINLDWWVPIALAVPEPRGAFNVVVGDRK